MFVIRLYCKHPSTTPCIIFLPKMSTTLPLFWHLSSASKDERIDASAKLISALQQFQATFTSKDSSDNEDVDEKSQSDGLDALNPPDVSYSLRRLIRGLASPTESSRLGFAVALTEVGPEPSSSGPA
jgi:DNA polymerase phi